MTCTVCRHPQRDKIDAEMMVSTVRDIAGRYHLKRMAVHRHKRGHLLPRVRRAAEKRADLNAEKLIDRLIMLAEQTDELLAQSIVDRDRRSSGILIGEVRRNVIMLGRVVGAPWVDRSMKVTDNRVQIAVTSLNTDQLKELIDNLTSRERKRQESSGSVVASGSNILESKKDHENVVA